MLSTAEPLVSALGPIADFCFWKTRFTKRRQPQWSLKEQRLRGVGEWHVVSPMFLQHGGFPGFLTIPELVSREVREKP